MLYILKESFNNMDILLYLLNLGIAGIGRVLDIGSTWYASRTLALESNLFAKKLGWKGIIILNTSLCFFFALEFYFAIVLLVVSAFAASNNLQKAWVTQTIGEKEYRQIFTNWVKQAESKKLYFSIIGGGIILLSIGILLMIFTINTTDLTGFYIGVGLALFASAIMFHQSLALFKIRKDKEDQKAN
ncbi:MAG: hypothetical protein ACFFD2_27995 [Promethearchaeota archaeon]